MQQTKVKVKINNDMTEQFEITSGVKQGDSMSALLFSTVMDVISKLEARGNISTRLKQILAYAADIIIIGRTKQVMTDMFTKLKNEASKFGLSINENDKVYKMYEKELRGNKLEIDTISFVSVQSFKYLGSVVNHNNTTEEEIKEGLIAGNKTLYQTKKFFKANYQGNLN